MACAALLACAGTAGADVELSPPSLSFVLAPSFTVPLGPGASYLLPGGAVDLAAEYALPSLPMLSLGGGVLFGLTPITRGLGTTSQVYGMLGAAWRVPIAGRLSARLFARGGYGLGIINGDPASTTGGSAVAEGGAGLSFAVSPHAVARLDASYLALFGAQGCLRIAAGLAVRPGAENATVTNAPRRRASLEIAHVDLHPLYPALRRLYENHPIGSVAIANTGRQTLSSLSMSFRIRGLMEQPRQGGSRDALKPGETWDAPLVAILEASALETPPTAAEAEVSVTFVQDGEQCTVRSTAMLAVRDRNALSGADPRATAAFVLPDDPPIRDIAGVVSAAARLFDDAGVCRTLRTASAVRDAIRIIGIRTTAGAGVPDGSPIDGGEHDLSIQYPRQTLTRGAGNGLDIAVLCASLLEACDVRTALFSAGGKTFVAIDPETAPGASLPPPLSADNLILLDGQAWLPFDVGGIDGDFTSASQRGLAAWRKGGNPTIKSLVSVREAWGSYPSPVLPKGGPTAPLPRLADLRAALDRSLGGMSASARDRPPQDGTDVRRVLLVFENRLAGTMSDLEKTKLADSLAFTMSRVDKRLVIIPYGDSTFPATDAQRIDVARKLSADCFLVIALRGDRSAPTLSTHSYDLLCGVVTIDSTVVPAKPEREQDPLAMDWQGVATLVGAAYATGTGNGAR